MALPAFPDVSKATTFPAFEGNNMEFKLSTQQIAKFRETICAFLNGNGGYIVAGVRDDRQIVGIDVAKHLDLFKRNIDDTFHQKVVMKEDGGLLAPGTVTVDTVPCANGKTIIVVKVVPEENCSYVTNAGEKFVRLNASNYRISQERYLPESLVKAKVAGEVAQTVGNLFAELEGKLKCESNRFTSKISQLQMECTQFAGIAKDATERAESLRKQLGEMEGFQKTLFDTILQQKKEAEEQLGLAVKLPWWKRICC